MTVEQIEERLENRFALLAGGDRTSPERERTLLAVIEWSWALLTPTNAARCAGSPGSPTGSGSMPPVALTGARPTPSGCSTGSSPSPSSPSRWQPERGRAALPDARDGARVRPAQAHRRRATRPTRSRRWTPGRCASRSGALDRVRGPDQITVFRELDLEQDNLVEVLRRAIATPARSRSSSPLRGARLPVDGPQRARRDPRLRPGRARQHERHAPVARARRRRDGRPLPDHRHAPRHRRHDGGAWRGAHEATRPGGASDAAVARCGGELPARNARPVRVPGAARGDGRVGGSPTGATLGSIMLSQLTENEGDPEAAAPRAARGGGGSPHGRRLDRGDVLD